MSLHYKIKFPSHKHPNQKNSPILVLLHGLGSNEEDLFSFAPMLDSSLMVVSPRAPLSYFGGYAWFSLDIMQMGSGAPVINSIEFENSRQLLISYLKELEQTYQPSKIILGGFSQGAMMSYAVALTRPDLTRHVLAMSGYVVKDIADKIPQSESLAGMQVLATHGTNDMVLPVFLARKTQEFMHKLPIKFEFYEYNMGHEVNQECFNKINSWINESISSEQID